MAAAGRREKDPPEIVAAIVGNLRSFWQLRAEPAPAESDGIVWWTSGGQRRAMNGVLALSSADPGPIADRIAATFRLSGLPCAWTEGPDPRSPELGLRLLGLGYRTMEGSRGWALPLHEARQGFAPPPSLLVRHGTDPDLVGTLSHLVGTTSLQVDPSDLAPLARLLEPRKDSEPVREEIWIALDDGEPAAGLLSHIEGDCLGIYALVTDPERRGQGFASALLLAAARAAIDKGLAWAVTEAPETQAGPLRRLGFREYCDFRRYGWEPHPPGAPSV